MRASWISRVRFEVRITIGTCSARIVPSSGTVTWKSESSSSRNASSSWSARSTSSISRTGDALVGGVDRLQERPLEQELLAEEVAAGRLGVDAAGRLERPQVEHLARVVPLVDGRGWRRAPRSTGGGSAACREWPPAPWRSRSCRRLPRLRAAAACAAERQVERRRQAAIGDVSFGSEGFLEILGGLERATGVNCLKRGGNRAQRDRTLLTRRAERRSGDCPGCRQQHIWESIRQLDDGRHFLTSTMGVARVEPRLRHFRYSWDNRLANSAVRLKVGAGPPR